ncbi:MAG TPA: type II CAAX endopeptidase family protein [Stackebrandtia sp.]|jgi:membrane protease YdiL (CAAX protease family)|uniref:type II CAAX endopeptidase family protein n=1 Tax=Stackebrandtia sp. TaxID=2023065 RepID=UPI002D32FBB5|nr:type II CAAX endopeptidase family protein [Stackebrandtia sp.]HZE40163.1 type II CAAX endopeptidase family protein [Stackebrandtia sp.]
MRVFVQLVTVMVVAFVGGQGIAQVQDKPWPMLGVGLATAVLALVVYGWVVRRTEKRPSTEVEWKSAAPGIAWGTLIGIVTFALVIVNIAFLEFYKVNGPGQVFPGPVGLFGYMAAAAVTEELLFRGVLFRWIEKATGTWISLVITGVLFGGYHMLNPDATVWGGVAIAIEAGGMLTAAYIATRKLWVPIGVHFGWNFAAAAIFSTEVSGNGSNKGLLDATTSGPMLVSGGHFGPEASLYSVLFCVLVAIGFLVVAWRRGNLVPLRRAARVEPAPTLSQ